jgi:hypothetical protein
MSTKVSGFSYSESIVPTITAGAYTAADQLGAEMVIDTGISDDKVHTAYVIQSISVVDLASAENAIDLLFFDASVTPAADNAAADFTDAELKASFLGHANIAATDYVTMADNSVGTFRNVGLQLKIKTASAGSAATKATSKIYCYAVVQGTTAYAGTTDLQFNFHLAADL